MFALLLLLKLDGEECIRKIFYSIILFFLFLFADLEVCHVLSQASYLLNPLEAFRS